MATKKSVVIAALLMVGVFLCRLWSHQETPTPAPSGVPGENGVELGFNSVEGAYYRPHFHFDFPVASLCLIAELEYRQYADSQLEGTIDYWVNVGLARNLGSGLMLEARLNHMCRHYISALRPHTYEHNELLGKIWWQTRHHRLALGLGGYTGGTEDFRTLLTVNGEFPRILDSPFSFRSELKWVDFQTIFHQLELSFSLSPSLDLFLDCGRDYGRENGYGLGIRLKPTGQAPDLFDSLFVQSGILTADDLYKMLVRGGFWVGFFPKQAPGLRLGVTFNAPVLRSEQFLGPTFPDKMVYELCLEYGVRLTDNLRLAGYGKYQIDFPVDRDLAFDSDLGIGLAVRNQVDFERLEKKMRFDVFAGFNFQHHYDLGARWGVNTLGKSRWAGGLELDFRLNPQQASFAAQLFADFGREVRIRPFLALQVIDGQSAGIRSLTTLIFGFFLFRWF